MHFLVHYDFLKWLGADGRASAVLDEGLARFPSAWLLHDRVRGRSLEENGVEGLHAAYEEMLRDESASPNIEWFAGYASMVAAEFHRRRPGGQDRALTSYDRAISHYERFIQRDPVNRDSADHYIAMALAGRSRIAYEREDFDGALAELLASFDRKPDAAGTLDGLNISPADTSRQLRSKFTELEREDLLTRLDAALEKLDPELLQLPAYETAGQRGRGRGGRGGRRGGRRGRRGGE
jgi:tetratricopeptide (TPR) repeat protein